MRGDLCGRSGYREVSRFRYPRPPPVEARGRGVAEGTNLLLVDGPQYLPYFRVLEHELPQPVVVLGEDH